MLVLYQVGAVFQNPVFLKTLIFFGLDGPSV